MKGIKQFGSYLIFAHAMFYMNYASAAGLDKAKASLTTFKSSLMLVIPVLAIVALIIIGLLYSMEMIKKDTLVSYAKGLMIVACSSEIVGIFLP